MPREALFCLTSLRDTCELSKITSPRYATTFELAPPPSIYEESEKTADDGYEAKRESYLVLTVY